MKIYAIECRERENCREMSAYIDKLQLWFRFPKHFEVDELDATCFVTAALLPSMLLGEDLVLDQSYSMSSQMYNQLNNIQEIYNHWNPLFRRIKVTANTKAIVRDGAGCGSFFSAGVDGTYSLCKHQADIQHLILINGFDFSMGNKTWQTMVEKNQILAFDFGKELVAVETNYKVFTISFGIQRYANYGTCLASISQLLGLNKVFFSGSGTYEHLYPDGAHALLDPLWSTELTEVVHTGVEADRTRKIGLIKEYPKAIANLWVCWKNPKRNCGRCSKCIRTYVALRLNGITNFDFEHRVTIRDLTTLSINDEHDYLFFSLFLNQAMNQGDHKLTKVLSRLIGKYKIKLFLLDMDKYFFSSRLKKLQLHLLGSADNFVAISIIPRHSGEKMAQIAISRIKDKGFVQKVAHVGSVYFRDETLDDDIQL